MCILLPEVEGCGGFGSGVIAMGRCDNRGKDGSALGVGDIYVGDDYN